VAVGVSSIAKASPSVAHLANKNLSDIRHAAVAYTFVRKVCAHSKARIVGQSELDLELATIPAGLRGVVVGIDHEDVTAYATAAVVEPLLFRPGE
jgi:hypothetical protein